MFGMFRPMEHAYSLGFDCTVWVAVWGFRRIKWYFLRFKSLTISPIHQVDYSLVSNSRRMLVLQPITTMIVHLNSPWLHQVSIWAAYTGSRMVPGLRVAFRRKSEFYNVLIIYYDHKSRSCKFKFTFAIDHSIETFNICKLKVFCGKKKTARRSQRKHQKATTFYCVWK